jgi:hypothetical protein
MSCVKQAGPRKHTGKEKSKTQQQQQGQGKRIIH